MSPRDEALPGIDLARSERVAAPSAVDHTPLVQAQAQRRQQLGSAPLLRRQRSLQSALDHSPQVAAQRAQRDALANYAGQQKAGRAQPYSDAKPAATATAPPARVEAQRYGQAARPHAKPPTPRAEVVQRKVGFEIESSNLPVTPFGANAVESVTNLLTDGYQWTDIGAKQATWYRETDHSAAISQAIEQARAYFHQHATAHKADLKRVERTAIVEYVTHPFNEMQKADQVPAAIARLFGARTLYGTNTMIATMNAIKAEIDALRLAQQNFGGVRIGVPPVGDFQAAALHYGLANPNGKGTAAHTHIMNQVNLDKQYVQATVGVLPEKLVHFLQLAADPTKAYNKIGAMQTPVSAQDPTVAGIAPLNFIGNMMSKVDAVVPGLVNALTTAPAGELPTANAARKTALDGYLRLTLHVTLGAVAWGPAGAPGPGYLGGVPKNMISFLPKTALHLIPTVMPTEVRTDRLRKANAVKFNALVTKVWNTHKGVGNWMKAQPGGAGITAGQIAGTAGGMSLTTSVQNYLSWTLGGVKDPFFVAQAAGRPPIKPDPTRKGIGEGWFNRNQTQAIAVETRHYLRKITAAQLPAFAQNIADLVNAAH